MAPLTRDRAVAFWRRVAQGVAAGERVLLLAEDALGVCGTVQLLLAQPENQPHRADLAKMLVHRRVRRQGLGAALMRAAEATARECGKTLLVLDAVTGGDAARLYERLGWTRVGDIPGYALFPRGGLCATTVLPQPLNQQHSRNGVCIIGHEHCRSGHPRWRMLGQGIEERLDRGSGFLLTRHGHFPAPMPCRQRREPRSPRARAGTSRLRRS